jgi:hypothetical protein
MASEIRANFIETALNVPPHHTYPDEASQSKDVEVFDRLQRRHDRKSKDANPYGEEDATDENVSGLKRKKTPLCKLSLDQKIDIVYQVVIDCWS